MVKVALWVVMEAKPGKEKELEKFLNSGLEIVQSEQQTITWYVIKLAPNSFGIFDTFETEEGRQAHLTGRLASALMAKSEELLTKPPSIEKLDIITAKVPK